MEAARNVRKAAGSNNSLPCLGRCACQCCGTTLVEVVISTVILSFISQILLYGFQIANTQASSALSKQRAVIEDANNCMEYLLRQLNSNIGQTSKITSAELASCQNRCQQLSSNTNQITISASEKSTLLLPNHRLQGYWITVTATKQPTSVAHNESSHANLDASNHSRSYSVSTLVSYHDGSINSRATTSTSADYHGKRTINLNADGRDACANLKRYERQRYIPLPSTLYFQLHHQCMLRRPTSDALDGSRVTFPTSAEEWRAKIEGFKYRMQQFIGMFMAVWQGEFNSALAQPHCFLDGVCVNSSKEAKELREQALRQLKSPSWKEKFDRFIKRCRFFIDSE